VTKWINAAKRWRPDINCRVDLRQWCIQSWEAYNILTHFRILTTAGCTTGHAQKDEPTDPISQLIRVGRGSVHFGFWVIIRIPIGCLARYQSACGIIIMGSVSNLWTISGTAKKTNLKLSRGRRPHPAKSVNTRWPFPSARSLCSFEWSFRDFEGSLLWWKRQTHLLRLGIIGKLNGSSVNFHLRRSQSTLKTDLAAGLSLKRSGTAVAFKADRKRYVVLRLHKRLLTMQKQRAVLSAVTRQNWLS